jgi:hypothetical protein
VGPVALLLIAGALVQSPVSDTATYADSATRVLVALAAARHASADSAVRDYQAKLRYRLSFAFGNRRWADLPTAAVEEQEATVQWALPNDLRVDVLGRRQASRIDGLNLSSNFARPWFVPRTLSDSIRVLGSDSPSRAAPHPLARDADRLYRYAAGEAVTVAVGGGRRVTIRAVRITPRDAVSAAVVGTLWLDVTTGDVVRFTFRFVGTELWNQPEGPTRADSNDARRANEIVSRILQLDADLEYALQDNQYWLPYRQVLSGRVTIPFAGNFTVPFEARTEFFDYTVNTGTGVTFTAAFRERDDQPSRAERVAARDSLRAERRSGVVPDSAGVRNRTGYLSAGGRYQIRRPPTDSLAAYDAWRDSLSLDVTDADRARLRAAMADLAGMAEELPGNMTGRPPAGLALDRLPDLLRYNRVQGTTFSLAARTRGPFAFSELIGTLRYGFADERVMATAALERDAPSGRLTISAGRDLADMDPFARGLTFGNTLRAQLVGRDDGAYLLAQGIRLKHEQSLALGLDLTLSALAEDQQSVTAGARAGIPRVFGSEGVFPPNPAIREGFATGGAVRLQRTGYRTSWALHGEVLHVGTAGTGLVAGRITADLRGDLLGGWLTPRVKFGAASRASEMPQMALRAGGMQTVRGYDFGTATGEALWAVQLDLARPGRGAVKRVLFLDAGQAASFASIGSAPVLVGAGVGYSLLGGLIRAELSHPLTHRNGRGLRFDLVFGGAR